MRAFSCILFAALVGCTRTQPTPTKSDLSDVGPPVASVTSDAAQRCAPGEEPRYLMNGCERSPTICRQPFECAASSVFCGCDGKTFHDCSPPAHAYAHDGPCPTTEGSPCASGNECTSSVCVFEPGCSPPKGKCTGGLMPSCAVAHAYCGCALGKTYHACLPTQPFSKAGECP
jgi:hypothetical protein